MNYRVNQKTTLKKIPLLLPQAVIRTQTVYEYKQESPAVARKDAVQRLQPMQFLLQY